MSGGSSSAADPAVAAVLGAIREQVVAVTGPSLVGLYLFGSLASGDFQPDVSDLDVLAVLADVPSRQLAARLRRMHAGLAQANRAWDDRIEVIYISIQGLATCRTHPTTIAVISPGERFHLAEARRDWILNWYSARQRGVRLLGPPINKLIPPIPTGEYLEEVRRSLEGFTNRIPDHAPPGSQAYAILTMCRGLHALRFGEPCSKREAAAWAQQAFPRWADLIGRALDWRQRQHDSDGQDGAATVAETRSLVAEMAKLALQ
jgi:predicted nucleotidyltransferase